MNQTERIYVRVTLEEKQKFERIAERERRTVSALLRIIFDEYMKRIERKK